MKDSGLLEGFCDYHCHLLPGVDDGVKTAEMSLEILRLWETLGVKEVWLTPHVMEDIPNSTVDLRTRFEGFKTLYGGSIGLHLAAENMLDNLFVDRLAANDLLTLGTRGDALLVETSYYNPPIGMERMANAIREAGYMVVLAHPERYEYMEMDDYKRWKQWGMRFQLNVPSLVGAYGPLVMKKAETLLSRGMYDFCGSDTHSLHFTEYFMNSKIKKSVVKEVKRIMESGL